MNIQNPSTPLTNCKDFTDYWNEWHKEWYKKANDWITTGTLPTSSDNILGWPIPHEPVWRDFPEPYWGNPCNPKAVFININPFGSGGDLRLTVPPVSPLYALYGTNGGVYSNTINDVAIPTIYPTGYEWHLKRAVWGSTVCSEIIPWNVNDILDLDLIPWHTNTAEEIAYYFDLPGVCELILNKVIIPAICIANTVDSCFSKNIIGKGTFVQSTIEKSCFYGIITPPSPLVMPSPDIYYQTAPTINKQKRWHISTANYNGAVVKIKVYVGGRNMALPPMNRDYTNGATPPVTVDTRGIVAL